MIKYDLGLESKSDSEWNIIRPTKQVSKKFVWSIYKEDQREKAVRENNGGGLLLCGAVNELGQQVCSNFSVFFFFFSYLLDQVKKKGTECVCVCVTFKTTLRWIILDSIQTVYVTVRIGKYGIYILRTKKSLRKNTRARATDDGSRSLFCP